MNYNKFMTTVFCRTGSWLSKQQLKKSVCVPGFVGDHKGPYDKFNRFYKRPRKSHLLWWRTHPKDAKLAMPWKEVK